MVKHNHGDAWNRKDFDGVFDLFEEDEPTEANKETGGLDKHEFLQLIKRIAQL